MNLAAALAAAPIWLAAPGLVLAWVATVPALVAAAALVLAAAAALPLAAALVVVALVFASKPPWLFPVFPQPGVTV